MDAATKPSEGWARVSGAEKRHYFRADRRSLCGRWACFGIFEPEAEPGKFDCGACAKKVLKLKSKSEEK